MGRWGRRLSVIRGPPPMYTNPVHFIQIRSQRFGYIAHKQTDEET